jgi:putative SOS response-associated peptidase YedK
MCGRYDLSDNPAAIRAKFNVPAVPEFAPNADWRPTNNAPVVRLRDDGSRECLLARWGLVPGWAPDLKFGTRCINARAETVASLPAFRNAFRRRRCLVPVNAFFEWSGEKGQRRKWRIALRDEPLFALAGLWEWWQDRESGEGVTSYTIVTCAANAAIAPLHDRMPVILREADYARWLDPATDAQPLLAPFDAEALALAPA